MARAGARVILAVKDLAKGKTVAATIVGDRQVRRLDLEDLASVRDFAARWTGPLDILVNNAGIMQVPEGPTVDGFERQIGTNHLGHFALTNLLLPHIVDRVVTVSSNAHARGRLNLEDLNWQRRPYRSGQAYSDSKLANLLFTLELQRRLGEAGSSVRAVSVHPGMVRTNLFGHATGLQASMIEVLGRLLLQDAAHGALTSLYAATREVPGGSYVVPGGFAMRGQPTIASAAPAAYDAAAARRLWDLSVSLTGIGPSIEAS
jgi:NAD(P)-dependent dehydrogenase (short-subunit alcohol dehydrogenase family)